MMGAQRRSLQVVADAGEIPTRDGYPASGTDTGVEYIDGRDEWRAQSVIRRWSPEHQLVGALMYLSAQSARPVLDLVPDTAVWRPITRHAIVVIRRLVAEVATPTRLLCCAPLKSSRPENTAMGPLPPSGLEATVVVVTTSLRSTWQTRTARWWTRATSAHMRVRFSPTPTAGRSDSTVSVCSNWPKPTAPGAISLSTSV